jgi:hypothetical protein
MEHGEDQRLDLAEFVGRRTLIVGDVNSGKTSRSRKILDAMCDAGLADRIMILDLAPEIPEVVAEKLGLRGVGGRLLPPPGAAVHYWWARTRPPRLTASSDDEAMAMAERNREEIDRVMGGIGRTGRDILFVNDVSLYLQAGSAENLVACLSSARTWVVNGYCGERLGKGSLSERERAEMEDLMKHFHKIVRLQAGPP